MLFRSSYATFAANGVYAAPWFITEVNGSNGGVLYQAASPSPNTVFSKEVMADLTYGLQAVVKNGTATYGTSGLGRPAAGKTGTSEQNASAWFSGYTPQLATSVAFFRDDATQSLNGIGGLNSVTGGSFPARIWNAYMKVALKDQPVMDFPAPTYIGGTTPAPITDPIPTITNAQAATWCTTNDLTGQPKDILDLCKQLTGK